MNHTKDEEIDKATVAWSVARTNLREAQVGQARNNARLNSVRRELADAEEDADNALRHMRAMEKALESARQRLSDVLVVANEHP
jgi:hypothetical protein